MVLAILCGSQEPLCLFLDTVNDLSPGTIPSNPQAQDSAGTQTTNACHGMEDGGIGFQSEEGHASSEVEGEKEMMSERKEYFEVLLGMGIEENLLGEVREHRSESGGPILKFNP